MAIFKLLDFNKDGEINEEEFVQVFRFIDNTKRKMV